MLICQVEQFVEMGLKECLFTACCSMQLCKGGGPGFLKGMLLHAGRLVLFVAAHVVLHLEPLPMQRMCG